MLSVKWSHPPLAYEVTSTFFGDPRIDSNCPSDLLSDHEFGFVYSSFTFKIIHHMSTCKTRN